MTCLTVIGGENIWKERAIASGFCETADGSVPKSKVNSFLRDFLKFVCANSLYCGGPKTLLTDQHLLRTNLFFVTETSELRLAGLSFEDFRLDWLAAVATNNSQLDMTSFTTDCVNTYFLSSVSQLTSNWLLH